MRADSMASQMVRFPSSMIVLEPGQTFTVGSMTWVIGAVGDIPPGTTRWYMGHTIRGGPARKIEACTTRLQVVLDIVIVPNRILYL